MDFMSDPIVSQALRVAQARMTPQIIPVREQKHSTALRIGARSTSWSGFAAIKADGNETDERQIACAVVDELMHAIWIDHQDVACAA